MSITSIKRAPVLTIALTIEHVSASTGCGFGRKSVTPPLVGHGVKSKSLKVLDEEDVLYSVLCAVLGVLYAVKNNV